MMILAVVAASYEIDFADKKSNDLSQTMGMLRTCQNYKKEVNKRLSS